MAKHSKVKNTGILFELLVRQITTDTLNGVDKSPAIGIIKEYFGKSTSLKKELYLYQTLVNEKQETEYRAEKFVDLVLKERAKISSSNLRREKYNLIKEIKNSYNIEEFFKAKISKYKQNASIYTLFESSNSDGFTNPKLSLQSRANIVESICKNINDVSHVDRVVEAFRAEDKDLRILAYKVLVDKFNSKYSKLSESQASILREYINNISNTESLRSKLQLVVAEHLKSLAVELKQVKDDVVRIKLKEVAKQIKNSIVNKKRIDEKKILNVLRLSELVVEVKNARKK
jgi:hypothetical protein|tara:strand:- start:2200 stop:3063 length:864 start_codon:yes stop_codon:yes gene_type:complete